MLVGRVRRALGSGDTGFGPLIGVLNVAVIGGGLRVKIVGLLDDGSGLGADVVLGRATDREDNDESTGCGEGKGRFYSCILTGRRVSRCSCYGFTGTRASVISLRLPHSEIYGSKRVCRCP
jgi:hypothetical protein